MIITYAYIKIELYKTVEIWKLLLILIIIILGGRPVAVSFGKIYKYIPALAILIIFF